jgi:uncharacterized protein with FMN-binding domain
LAAKLAVKFLVRRIIMKVTVGLLIILILASCNSTSLAEITASLPDMKNKSDGVYRGSYDLSGTPVKVTLDVTVQNQTITMVKIVRHSCSPIGKKAEKITGTIIERQSLNIDAVSGATGSSMAILKAVENALE